MSKKEGGKLIFCGDDNYRLGFDSLIKDLKVIIESKEIKKVACGIEHIMVLKSNGELHENGDKEMNSFGEEKERFTLLMKDKNIKDVLCGRIFSLIQMKSGEIFVFRKNNEGNFCILGLFNLSNDCLLNSHVIKRTTWRQKNKIHTNNFH